MMLAITPDEAAEGCAWAWCRGADGIGGGMPGIISMSDMDSATAAGRSGLSDMGMFWIRGSTFWISVRGRCGRSGLAAGRRAGAGAGAGPARRFAAAAGAAGSSRRITSRGCGSFLPCRIAWTMSVSMLASSPSTRTPMDFSLKTRS
jgi:hypothetical protein